MNRNDFWAETGRKYNSKEEEERVRAHSDAVWSLTAKTVFGDRDLKKEYNRQDITESVYKHFFGRKPIQTRHFGRTNPPPPEANMFNLVKEELRTVFFYIDNKGTTAYSQEGDKLVVVLLKKYSKFFKDFPSEHDKLKEAIKYYRRKK